MEPKRIFDIVERYTKHYGMEDIVFAWRDPNKQIEGWHKMTVREYAAAVDNMSYALLHLGIKKGDKVGIVSGNRPEWNIIDYAAMQIGAISVPIYPTISQADYRHIISISEMKIIFMEGKELRQKIEPLLPEMTLLKTVVTMGRHEDNKYPCYQDIIDLGIAHPAAQTLKELKDSISENDLATLIFTSGTTGVPKGVMLSHKNIIMQVLGVRGIYHGERCRTLSFLPLCHAYERMMVYYYQYEGWTVYYCRNVGTIAQDLKEADPAVMTCVPRILEKIFDKLIIQGKKQSLIKRTIFFWAVSVAENYQFDDRSLWYNIKWKIADRLIYKKLREGIGGHFQVVVSGGSAIQPRMSAFFSAIGMPIIEGYGLSETSPVITVSRTGKYQRRPGCVGVALPGVEVKIADDGEIICRGDNVMIGYYNNPEMTKEVIDTDGWFHTGDTGILSKEGLLTITGRKKSLFKTSLGKYVNPEPIENLCSESPMIENLIVLGENQRFVTALISPDFTYLKLWARQHHLHLSTPQQICESAEVKKEIKKDIAAACKQFGEWEKIQKFTLVKDQWTTDNFLSPTLKVKRQKVMEAYKAEIDAMYN